MSKPKTPRVTPPRGRRPEGVPFLSLDERTALRQFLASPLYVKVATLVNASKPPVFSPTVFGVDVIQRNPDAATLAANNRLHEIRGWEMFEASLFLAANDPLPPPPNLEETFETR